MTIYLNLKQGDILLMITIQDVIDKLEEPIRKTEDTVDNLEFGRPDTIVNGVLITFMASYRAIQKANELGVNLIISHEGIFYSHRDIYRLLRNNPVYMEKKRLIQESGLGIYRFHDIIHKYQPDPVTLGLIKSLNWEAYIKKQSSIYTTLKFPLKPLSEIVQYIKNKLGIPFLRVTGNLYTPCEKIGILVGFRGGVENSIPLYEEEDVDLIITGEGPEWETPEYVLDANSQGKEISLITLGHLESEESGMAYFAEILKDKFPSISIHFYPKEKIYTIN